MQVLDAAETARLLDYPSLIDSLARGFAQKVVSPGRAHHDTGPGTLMLMPAWREGAAIGVKLLTLFGENPARHLPFIQASYLLFDGATGTPRLLLDGTELTRRRTGAMAALAARHLARPDAQTLLMAGTGALALHCVRAHAALGGLRRVLVWGRDAAKAGAVAGTLAAEGMDAAAAPDLAAAVAAADIIVCATSARTPFLRGDWLRPGQHVSLLGSYQPGMAEADDTALRRSRVFADTREGVLTEAGEIAGAMARGVFRETDIVADLPELARGEASGRTGAAEITLFKSVGTAIADLAGAELVAARV